MRNWNSMRAWATMVPILPPARLVIEAVAMPKPLHKSINAL